MRSSLMKRMKENYEKAYDIRLPKRMPLIIRIDGKAFHTFTKGFKKPFDAILMKSMQTTMLELCKNIQNIKLGYTQSDEISLLLTDYDCLETSQWFDSKLQKIVSVSASSATLYFNKVFAEWANKNDELLIQNMGGAKEKDIRYADVLMKASKKGAMFDARAFVLPKEEVTNYFLARQNDATRNSIQSLGQKYFSHKELIGKSQNEIQNMLYTLKGVNWNDLSIDCKRGVCAIRDNWNKWFIDPFIPIWKNEDRYYIERYI